MDDDETDDDSSLEVEWDDTRGASLESILSSLFQGARLIKFIKVLKHKEKKQPGYMKALFTSMFANSNLTEGQIDEKVNAIVQDFSDNASFRFENEAKHLGAKIVVETLLEKGLIKIPMQGPQQKMFTPG